MVENMKVLNFKYIYEAAFWECIPYGNYKGGCIDLFKYLQVSLKLLARDSHRFLKCIFKSNKMLFLCRTFCPFKIYFACSFPASLISLVTHNECYFAKFIPVIIYLFIHLPNIY